MGALVPSSIRSRISASLAGNLAASWTQSRYVYDAFPGKDASQVISQSYVVGVLTPSTFSASDRQRATDNAGNPIGAFTETDVGVRFSARIRADAQIEDTDAALDLEADLIVAIKLTGQDPDLAIRVLSVPRREVLAASDYTVYVGEIRLLVTHFYPLA